MEMCYRKGSPLSPSSLVRFVGTLPKQQRGSILRARERDRDEQEPPHRGVADRASATCARSIAPPPASVHEPMAVSASASASASEAMPEKGLAALVGGRDAQGALLARHFAPGGLVPAVWRRRDFAQSARQLVFDAVNKCLRAGAGAREHFAHAARVKAGPPHAVGLGLRYRWYVRGERHAAREIRLEGVERGLEDEQGGLEIAL
ncbi:hypothetical protein EI94DRAFT_1804378 [Lactarius quietus]|nr:hypothetical protein EI94DRAFT_1804378 [Lactarius quietus]